MGKSKAFVFLFLFISVWSAKGWATPSPRIEAVVPSLSQAMGESDVDSLKKMLGTIEKKLASMNKTEKSIYTINVEYGVVCHNIALYGAKKGNRGFAAKCFDRMRKSLSDGLFPDSLKPVALSYMGSARTLMGDEVSNPVNKVKFVNEGVDILNNAVDRYGKGSFIPRFMRANVFFALPDFFEKESAAIKDYKYLEECYLSGPAKPDAGIMAFVYLNRGNYCKKNRDMKKAMAYWKKSISIAPSSTSARTATKLIALFGE